MLISHIFQKPKTRLKGKKLQWPTMVEVREKVDLLSRFATDPTVGGLRGKKEKCSTRDRLRVDPGFASF